MSIMLPKKPPTTPKSSVSPPPKAIKQSKQTTMAIKVELQNIFTQEFINDINSECFDGQGIFTEPYGILDDIKEPVIYMRWETGGVSGGHYDDDYDNPQPYTKTDSEPKFKVLTMILEKICPNITFLQFQKIEELIMDNRKSQWEYYGNRTDYAIKFIPVSHLLNYLNSI